MDIVSIGFLGSGPALEEPLHKPNDLVFQELLKFVVQNPGSMDLPISFVDGIEGKRFFFGAVGGRL